MRRCPRCCGRAWGTGSVIVKTAPGAVGAVGGGDRAAHRFDEAAADGKAKAGAGPNLIAFLRRGRTCRRCAPDLPAGMPPPSSMTCSLTTSSSRQPRDAHGRAGRRIFRGVVEEVEQHLLEQHGIELEHRQVGREIDLDAMLRQDLARRAQGRCRRSRRHRAGAVFGLIAPDSSLVMSSRLAMKRLSRSDSSRMVREQVGLGLRSSELARQILERAGGAEDRGERRLQIVRDGGEQRRAQPVRLDAGAWPGRHPRRDGRARWQAPPGRSARRAGGAGRASAAGPAGRCRGRRRRWRRARCASAGTAAWRPAGCRRRGPPARLCSQAHFAAARSASSSVSSGG